MRGGGREQPGYEGQGGGVGGGGAPGEEEGGKGESNPGTRGEGIQTERGTEGRKEGMRVAEHTDPLSH